MKSVSNTESNPMARKEATIFPVTRCPGFNPKYGWLQRHDKEIAFVYERTFHPSRPDLEEVLAPWGMSAGQYNKWEFLKLSKGLHFRDKWRVTQDKLDLTDED